MLLPRINVKTLIKAYYYFNSLKAKVASLTGFYMMATSAFNELIIFFGISEKNFAKLFKFYLRSSSILIRYLVQSQTVSKLFYIVSFFPAPAVFYAFCNFSVFSNKSDYTE